MIGIRGFFFISLTGLTFSLSVGSWSTTSIFGVLH